MTKTSTIPSQSYWFVGASYAKTIDQTSRFIREGIWHNGYDDKYLALVCSMKPGDKIAIKSTFRRKYDLPFDNRGQYIPVMAIKATGTVTENMNDGRLVRVVWSREDPHREWYYHIHLPTIRRVTIGSNWKAAALIAFTFDKQPQNMDLLWEHP